MSRGDPGPTGASEEGEPAGTPGRPPAGTPAGTSDRDLLARHVTGDVDAFGELFRRHRDRLWAVALRTMADPDDAADALQDAVIAAMRAAGSFRGDAAVTTWLHRIVVNACLDRMRRRAARPAGPLPDNADVPARRDEIGEREVSLDVLDALRTLPVEQRAALVLVDMEGWPVEEAARLLGVPPGTVKSRCARGRARLLPLLSSLRGEGAPGNPPAPGGVRSAGERARAARPGTAEEGEPGP